jgi:hypothetical protein
MDWVDIIVQILQGVLGSCIGALIFLCWLGMRYGWRL